MSGGQDSKGKDQSASSHDPYVPLSVRYGGRREKLGWWLSTQRERLAVKLAPWLKPHYGGYQAVTFEDDVEVERLRAALQHIASTDGDTGLAPFMREIATAALRSPSDALRKEQQ
jgi:hypothetical protein